MRQNRCGQARQFPCGAFIKKGVPLHHEAPEIRPHAVYTLPEACRLLQVSDATLRRWIKDGRLNVGKVGRTYRILGSQLLEALGAGSNPTT